MPGTVRHAAVGVGHSILLALAAACSDGTSPDSSSRPAYVAVAAGAGFTCALTSEQATYCWGYTGFLTGGPGRDSIPSRLDTPEPLASLTAGDFQLCGIGESGLAYCRGSIIVGHDMGVGYPGGWHAPDSLRFLQVTAGRGHACGLTADSTARCWGDYGAGRRGQGGPMPIDSSHPWDNWDFNPNPVIGGLRFRGIAGGMNHTCGILPENGDLVACWGDSVAMGNARAAYSHGDSICDWYVDACTSQPVVGPALSGVTLITSGWQHTCALASQGLRCWGSNDYLALGASGHFGDTPSIVTLPGTVTALSAGGLRTCALVLPGVAWCWGAISVDQTGAYVNDSTLPEAVPFADQFVSLSTGWEHTCGLTDRGRLFCWGSNWNGELGDGSTRPSPVPVEVAAPRS